MKPLEETSTSTSVSAGDGFYGGTLSWPQQPRRPVMSSGMTAAAVAPVPKSCPVQVVSLPHAFQEPSKRITSASDLERFHSSLSGNEFLGFIVGLSEAIKGRKLSDPCHESATIKAIMSMLDAMCGWADDIPPRTQSARYGNPAYRDWHEQLLKQGPGLLNGILPQGIAAGATSAVDELFPYLADSFGNATRIDYGTGHEANFAAFLLCLTKIGLLKEEDYQAIVSRVFVKYLDLMRKLQLSYWLEPAGSHGVWGLDDYHFLPFVFGAAQLIDHKYMKPKSVHNDDILENFSKEYFYLGCVQFVKKVKKGPLAEHSPMIDDISGVPSWSKVHTGMLKMYKAELLDKFPIMQHFLFGSLIKWCSVITIRSTQSEACVLGMRQRNRVLELKSSETMLRSKTQLTVECLVLRH